MSIAAPLLLEPAMSKEHSTVECRVYQRHPCEVPTSCQPASVQEMRETRWSATICDISQGGLGLNVERRYERGAALAVELPGDSGQSPSVVFVRVVHVKRNSDGLWRLGCRFISELSDDDVRRLLRIKRIEPLEKRPAPSTPNIALPSAATKQARTVFFNVRVEIGDLTGASFRMTIKQLNVSNNHSVAPGEQLRIVGGMIQGKQWSVQIEVDQLAQVGDQWNLRGFLEQPRTVSELAQLIKLSKQRS